MSSEPSEAGPGSGPAAGTIGGDAVRPLRCRVVRQECAARVVRPLLDPLAATGAQRPAAPGSDPDAYAEEPTALYVYRLRDGVDEHVGVVCDVRAEAFVSGQVRGHESVQPDRLEALVRHYATAPARSEPVALLHAAGPVAAGTVAETLRSRPLVRFAGPDGFEHTVWRVPDGPATSALADELSRSVHYIADGHHRVAASLREWRAAGRPPHTGLLCVIYPFDGLHLSAFHRRVAGPVDPDGLLGHLAGEFDVRPVSDPADATGCFGLYVGGRWFAAGFTGDRPVGAGGLDVTILHEHVLGPVLGITGPREPRLEITSAQESLLDLVKRCNEDGGALFTLRPPALSALTDLADRGEVLPPKTTYFAPKPYAGIFLR
jgi:uncharacterized protein (DUF1015 family)